MLQEEAAASPGASPLANKQPHHPARAKHVIHLFMNGGPSQVDTFDRKPLLDKYDGKTGPIRRFPVYPDRKADRQHPQWSGVHGRQLLIAALLTDLKHRGLLDETLILWGGEFGRTPTVELPAPGTNEGLGKGRDHNNHGFTVWMAGGGVKGGQTIGATDELGLYAVEDKMHVHDIHSTIMALLGLDHTEVVYMHKGRPERIDLNEGHVNEGLFEVS